MERTLVILKPGCLQRGLIGEVISRFEKRGLKLVAMKMVQLDEEILKVHYAHLLDRPFFPWLRDGTTTHPSNYPPSNPTAAHNARSVALFHERCDPKEAKRIMSASVRWKRSDPVASMYEPAARTAATHGDDHATPNGQHGCNCPTDASTSAQRHTYNAECPTSKVSN